MPRSDQFFMALPAAAILFAAAGCAAPPGEGSSTAPPTTDVHSVESLFPARDVAVKRNLWEGQRTLIRKCMAEKGYDFTFPPYEVNASAEAYADNLAAEASNPQASFGKPEVAKASGYQIDPGKAVRLSSEHLGPEYSAPKLDQAGSNALYGSPSDKVIEIPQPDGTTIRMLAGGCYYLARKALYGDPVSILRAEAAVDNVHTEILQEVASDPILSRANHEWSHCMENRGWPGLTTQVEAFNKAMALYAHSDSSASRVERELAVADAECVVSSDYAAAQRQATERIVQKERKRVQAITSPLLEMQAKALKIAASLD